MSGWFSWNFGKCRQESSTYATVTEGLSVTSIFKVSPLRQLDRVQWKEKKTTTTKKQNNNNKHENRNNPTYPAGAGWLWGWIWWSSLVSFFLLNACLKIWRIFRLNKKKKKKRKGIKHKLPWINSYAQSWLFRDYSILLCKIGKFCIANSRVSPPTILRTQTRIGQFCINYSGFCRFHYRHSCRQNSNNNETPFST